MLANKISSQEELTSALKRLDHLWDAQHLSAVGSEFYQLVNMIYSYEGKSWDSYFEAVDAASDDFMAEREDVIEKKGEASDVLSSIKTDENFDDDATLEISVDEENVDLRLKELCQMLSEPKIEILETLARVWTKYPDQGLTQLIVNAIPVKSPCPEIFYIEDSEIINKLKLLLEGKST